MNTVFPALVNGAILSALLTAALWLALRPIPRRVPYFGGGSGALLETCLTRSRSARRGATNLLKRAQG